MTSTASPAVAFAPGLPFHAQPRAGEATLAVVVYHYVRDRVDGSRFPGIKGVTLDEFREQVGRLAERYEMATLDSALDFLTGDYQPSRSLCLLTFDDGLKDHYRDVSPILRDAGIQGLFFLTSRCLDGHVLAVHKNHHLMAGLDFETYRTAFMSRLGSTALSEAEKDLAQRAYPWDSVDVGQFKYLLNYRLAREQRDAILDALFAEFIGDERAFADELYLTAAEAREMQADGMVMGGHSHEHTPLSSLDESAQRADLMTCATRLKDVLSPQARWPFSYPYGYFNALTIESLRAAGFSCSFALDGGDNRPQHDLFRVRRIDTKDLVF